MTLLGIIKSPAPPAVPPGPPEPPRGNTGGGGEGDAVNLREAIERAQDAAQVEPVWLNPETARKVLNRLSPAEERAWTAMDLPQAMLSLTITDIAIIARHFGRNL